MVTQKTVRTYTWIWKFVLSYFFTSKEASNKILIKKKSFPRAHRVLSYQPIYKYRELNGCCTVKKTVCRWAFFSPRKSRNYEYLRAISSWGQFVRKISKNPRSCASNMQNDRRYFLRYFLFAKRLQSKSGGARKDTKVWQS